MMFFSNVFPKFPKLSSIYTFASIENKNIIFTLFFTVSFNRLCILFYISEFKKFSITSLAHQ